MPDVAASTRSRRSPCLRASYVRLRARRARTGEAPQRARSTRQRNVRSWRSSLLWCGCDAEFGVERGRIHRASEKRTHFGVGFFGARGCEYLRAVPHPDRGIFEPASGKRGEEVLRVEIRPEIRVIPRIVS